MVEYIESLYGLILYYPALQYLIIFLGAAFGGEAAVISLAFFAAQNVFPIVPFFLVSFIGTLSSDILWFLMGKTKTISKITEHRYAHNTVSVIVEAINKISRGNHLLAFIFAKFLIGTRIVVILYVSRTNITLKKFISNDLLAIFIWLVVLISIGFLSGLGFTYISKVLKNIYAGVGFIILILLVFIVAQIWLKKIFTKEGEKSIDVK